MAGRLDCELPRAEAADLRTATDVLVGLKYELRLEGFEQGNIQGRAEIRLDDLILMGTRRFGTEPGGSTVAAIRRLK